MLTMRSDYLGDCAQFRDLPETINDAQYLIPRLTREQRREIVVAPVRVAGAAIKPRLTERLLNDVGDDPDQLPILQHALMRTWDRWAAGGVAADPLDIPDYEAVGRMAAALSQHADEVFHGLGGARPRGLAERLFKTITDKAYRRLAETALLHGEGKARLWGDPDLSQGLRWRERERPNAQTSLNQVKAFVDTDRLDRLINQCPLLFAPGPSDEALDEEAVARCAGALRVVPDLLAGLEAHRDSLATLEKEGAREGFQYQAGSLDGAQRNPGLGLPDAFDPGFRCGPSGLRTLRSGG